MPELPAGTVTLLVADIADWGTVARAAGDAAPDVLDTFESVIASAAAEAGGQLVEQTGDTAIAVFARARDAVAAAADAQRRLVAEVWPGGTTVGVGIGIHTGEPTLGRARYVGVAVNRAVRICNLTAPGQVLASHTTAALAADAVPPGVSVEDLGETEIPDFDRPERVVQLVIDGVPAPRGLHARRVAAQLPGGTVTMLFTDIEGSTRLLRELGEQWGGVQSEHRRIIRAAAAATRGREVDNQGDALFFVFARARDAVEAAAHAQRGLAAHAWPGGVSVRVRMGIHTGEPTVGDEGYLGLDVVRAARICAAGHGGQVLVSEATRAVLGSTLADGVALRDLGAQSLKDLDEPERVHQLVVDGLPSDFPPLKTSQAQQAWGFDAPDSQRGGALELPSRMAEAVRSLEQVSELGPRIEREVGEALRAAGVERGEAAEVNRAVGAIRTGPSMNAALVFAAFVVLLVAVAIVAIVYAIA